MKLFSHQTILRAIVGAMAGLSIAWCRSEMPESAKDRVQTLSQSDFEFKIQQPIDPISGLRPLRTVSVARNETGFDIRGSLLTVVNGKFSYEPFELATPEPFIPTRMNGVTKSSVDLLSYLSETSSINPDFAYTYRWWDGFWENLILSSIAGGFILGIALPTVIDLVRTGSLPTLGIPTRNDWNHFFKNFTLIFGALLKKPATVFANDVAANSDVRESDENTACAMPSAVTAEIPIAAPIAAPVSGQNTDQEPVSIDAATGEKNYAGDFYPTEAHRPPRPISVI